MTVSRPFRSDGFTPGSDVPLGNAGNRLHVGMPASQARCGFRGSERRPPGFKDLRPAPINGSGRLSSQAQVQTQRLVYVEHDRVWDNAQQVTDSLHGYRSDLLRLRLGIAIEPGVSGSK
jgi:hypothetical protein